jgi:hypothetical protein
LAVAGKASAAAVAMAAFVFGFHKIDDFDTWWHLSAGRWITTHGLPATDTLSHTVRDHAWINLQWGFDLIAYFLFSRGGAVALCLFGALVFSATVVLLVQTAARHLGNALAALLVLVVVIAAEERVTLRPELLSFLLLGGVLSVLDDARRSEGKRLFVLVPLMAAWANVHALFVVGVFAIVCALIGTGTRPSRRSLIWSGGALLAVVVNPFWLEGVLFPAKLWSRINGSSAAFQTVGEFASPFAAGAGEVSIVVYKVLLFIGVAAAIAAFFGARRLARSRAGVGGLRFDWGGLIFFAGLAVLSANARRNVALFAIGSVPFIARSLEIVLASRVGLREFAVRRGPAIATVTGAVALALSASVVTGAFYKVENSPQEFGAGVIEGTFPVRAAAFARAAALPSKLYNDMASGGYFTWDPPVSDGVFVDGRLEVYDTPFITGYVTGVASPVRWQADADRYGVQTAIIFHRFENDRVLAGRLAGDAAWSLVYVDEVAAVFVRTQGNEAAIRRAAEIQSEWDAKTNEWLTRPSQKWPYPAGRIEGTRAYARVLATIGRAEPAIKAYQRLLELGISSKEEVERLLLARYFAGKGRRSEAEEQVRLILAIDPGNAEARGVLR